MSTKDLLKTSRLQRFSEEFRPLGRLSYWHAVLEAWKRHHCAARAASLTFVTILSLVPLAALTVAVFEALGDPTTQDALVDFLGRHVFPVQGSQIAGYIQSFAANVRIGALGPIGLTFSLAVTYLLFANVERAFGDIWQSQEKRSLIRKFTVFWTLATLGPLLMAVSVVQGAGLVHQFALFRLLLPFLATSVLLILVNRLMPNRRVPWSSAFVGGILSSVVFETSKYFFALYFTKMAFGNYRVVYGRLALLPVLLVWIHLSWSAVLMGAVAARVLASPEEPKRVSRSNGRVALRVMVAIAQWYRMGHQAIPRAELAGRMDLPAAVLDDVLTRLRNAGLVVRVSGDTDGFMPARPLDQIKAAEVTDLFEEPDVWVDHQDQLDELLRSLDEHTRARLESLSISDLTALPLNDPHVSGRDTSDFQGRGHEQARPGHWAAEDTQEMTADIQERRQDGTTREDTGKSDGGNGSARSRAPRDSRNDETNPESQAMGSISAAASTDSLQTSPEPHHKPDRVP